MADEWKERHVEAWVPLSPAYGGVSASLLKIVTGNTLGIPFVRPQDVRDQQRKDESALWLLPDPVCTTTHQMTRWSRHPTPTTRPGIKSSCFEL